MDPRGLVVVLWLWSSEFFQGLQTDEQDTFKEITHVRLMGGSSPCSGVLQVKRKRSWTEVDDSNWDLKLADVVCRHLDCGSVVQTSSTSDQMGWRRAPSWMLPPSCLESESRLRKCITKRSTIPRARLGIICSESVRLVNGTSLCSGRLEVKSDQSDQSWSSVCEDDFDQQDAEVVCRELGCGAPSVLQGALYGDGQSLMWTKEFQCEGHESVLLDCHSSVTNTDSAGKAVGLTCSEPNDLRLVGGSSRCAGELEMKQMGTWEKVDNDMSLLNLKTADVVCGQLDCGSAVSTRNIMNEFYAVMWLIRTTCVQPKTAVRECLLTMSHLSLSNIEIKCSESVRLVNGTSLCSGRLEVKSDQSDQSWSSVCEDDFDRQDAEVVCRELGCGVPSVLQGALYGESESPMWTKEFQCEGHESVLLDCRSSARNTGSAGKAVGLNCSDFTEPDEVKLVGGSNHCVGGLELKHEGNWRPVDIYSWDLVSAAVVCRQLDCGSALSIGRRDDLYHPNGWRVKTSCGQSDSTIRECVFIYPDYSVKILEVTCSDFLVQPNISFATHTDGVSKAMQQGFQLLMGSEFTISCSTLPQQPGGSFQLVLTTSATSQNYTLPAVNHSAHFLFPAADSTHSGEYRCVYHLYVFFHNLSSESQPLRLTVLASVTHLLIRLVVMVLMVVFSAALFCAALFCYCKANSGTAPRREDAHKFELGHLGGADNLLGEEAEVQGAEHRPDGPLSSHTAVQPGQRSSEFTI
ncbi:scavenger receptor cysteine-rich type 1 protein M130-like [Cyclopterus lumpus]|uniref:scavenger receptor cysteine-rich type 1 protein M130-like n=1 Tax=Cyclopterus lumpus TaxID=8103 RepID=UPI001486373E|nr:scavenger receptor cysteine-rich type 1 protein M130-like [Cyclopterus lumpus]